jgi:hypothetical protein
VFDHDPLPTSHVAAECETTSKEGFTERPTVGQNIEDARVAARLGLLRRQKRELGALLEDQRGVLAHGEAGRVSVDSASRPSHLTIGSLPATVMR